MTLVAKTSFQLAQETAKLPREATLVASAVRTREGAGATVLRGVGNGKISNKICDPFLMFDHFFVKSPFGFPTHPHFGMMTVTKMNTGQIEHIDGNIDSAICGSGDLQIMGTHSGIHHSEMPTNQNGDMSTGFQLWVNDSAKNKQMHPTYEEYPASKTRKVSLWPDVPKDGFCNFIWGKFQELWEPPHTITPTSIMEFSLKPGKEYSVSIPSHWNVFCYVLRGSGEFGSNSKAGNAGDIIVFKTKISPENYPPTKSGPDDEFDSYNYVKEWETTSPITIRAISPLKPKSKGQDAFTKSILEAQEPIDEMLQVYLVAGRPLNEPIFQYGPFVMNTREELYKIMLLDQMNKLAKVPKIIYRSSTSSTVSSSLGDSELGESDTSKKLVNLKS